MCIQQPRNAARLLIARLPFTVHVAHEMRANTTARAAAPVMKSADSPTPTVESPDLLYVSPGDLAVPGIGTRRFGERNHA
ncbi:MAG TPA: hypothetical protein DEU95_00980 [Chloroflexi bacterium]|nr:hypothetical protein [Chloroflexota bacterium]HBY46220.1 hypothetical protein [Chloroflexota bacterium]HCG28341.1 hypothetical protein [Chloroflexota bacterium]